MTTNDSNKVSLTDLLGKGVQCYADNFQVFFNISFLCAAPMVLNVLLNSGNDPADNGINLVTLLVSPFLFLVNVFFSMCLAYAVASTVQQERPVFSLIVGHVRQRFLRGLGGSLLMGMGTFLGVLLLILPGIYFFTVFYFFIWAILLEDTKVIEGFKRSYQLVKPRFWMVLGAHALMCLLALVVFLPVAVGLGMLGVDRVVIDVLGGVVSALVTPAIVAFYYLIYTQLKTENDHVLNISVHA